MGDELFGMLLTLSAPLDSGPESLVPQAMVGALQG